MADVLIEPIEDFGLSKKHKVKTLFSKIGVVGCGKEGQNIARIAGIHGMEVVFIELSQAKIDEAMKMIGKKLDEAIDHWGMTQGEKRAILSRIKGSTDYSALKDCDFVIEAIRSELSGRKITDRKEVFHQVEEIVDPECIIATNSTTIVITELSSDLKYQDRCLSLHFFTNLEDARAVEVVRGLFTSDEVYEKVCKFVEMINHEVIPVEEAAGLLGVRLYMALLNEACETLSEGVGLLPNIDRTMELGFGMSYGPFELADRVGLDKVERWMENLYNEFGKVKYKPSPLIKKLVRARRLGVKTGMGFYEYNEQGVIDKTKFFRTF